MHFTLIWYVALVNHPVTSGKIFNHEIQSMESGVLNPTFEPDIRLYWSTSTWSLKSWPSKKNKSHKNEFGGQEI